MKTGKKVMILLLVFVAAAVVYFVHPVGKKEEHGVTEYTAMEKAKFPVLYATMGHREMAPVLISKSRFAGSSAASALSTAAT